MTGVEAEQVENQAAIIKEEIETLIDTSNTIEDAVIQTAHETQSFGKTLDQWHKELSIRLDPSADPAKVKLYCSQLGNSLDIAYRNLSKAKVIAFNYNLSYNKAFNEKITVQALNKSRKVAPAIETMTRVAENQLPERTLTLKKLEMTIDFWEGMVWKIKDQVNIVNTISMANGTLLKVGEY